MSNAEVNATLSLSGEVTTDSGSIGHGVYMSDSRFVHIEGSVLSNNQGAGLLALYVGVILVLDRLRIELCAYYSSLLSKACAGFSRVPGCVRLPAQSRQSGDGPRCRGGRQVRTSGAAPPRDWPVRRGRDRVRGGAASNVVFGSIPSRPGAPMASRYVTVLEAGRRGPTAGLGPRKHPMAAAGAGFWPWEVQLPHRQPSWGHRLASRHVQDTQRIV